MRNDIWSEELLEQADDEIDRLRSENEDLAERIDELMDEIDELKKPKWISVNDRLPSYETMVIVYSELCGIGLAFIDNRDEKWCGDCHDEDVLYWMPLPEPPEKG